MSSSPKKSHFSPVNRLNLVVGLCIAIILTLLSFTQTVQFWGMDTLFQLRGERQPDTSVVIVEFNNIDIDNLGFPISREQIGGLQALLTESGAKYIAYDMLFNPFTFDPEGDSLFSVFSSALGNGLHAVAFHVPDQNFKDYAFDSTFEAQISSFGFQNKNVKQVPFWKATSINAKPYPSLLESSAGLGHISMNNLNDGTFRKVPVFLQYGDNYFPSLGFLLVSKYLGLGKNQWFDVKSSYGFMSLEMALDGKIKSLNIEPDGSLIPNFYGSYEQFPNYSYTELTTLFDEGKMDSLVKIFRGKMVVIGHSSNMVGDYGPTPYGELTPLCLVHATVASNIVKNELIQGVPFWISGLALFILIFLAFFCNQISLTKISMLLSSVLLVFPFLLSFLLFTNSFVWMGWVIPTSGIFLITIWMQAHRFFASDKEKKKIRSAFIQYLPETVVKELMAKPDLLRLGGTKQELTVLFSDVAGFTTISEKLTPEELVDFLNHYLGAMTDIVMKYEGTLDKYIGDAIMAFWGAPVPQQDHAIRACKSALEMVEVLKKMLEQWRLEGKPDIWARYGINSGEMVVGNMGSAKRFNYTVMGDAVNLSARLEPANKEFGSTLMISEFTLSRLSDEFITRQLDQLVVKGKTKPVKVYELLACKGITPEFETWIEPVQIYNEAMTQYYNRNFAEAIRLFSKVTDLKPDDGPSQTYVKRSEAYLVNPPEENWDGTFIMKHK
ncbi:MAG: adenylate/guanylate cyclase domain-containing protein [Bacteroidetes bacterium]|nr:adenylate/guanylate cyclase domain-containing protein [Bacteroidota bacterium]